MKILAFLRLGLLLLFVHCFFTACKDDGRTLTKQPFITSNIAQRVNHAKSNFSEEVAPMKVYVCNSSGAKKYHYKQTCRGLGSCKHEIVTINKEEAQTRGLGLCGWEN